MILLNTMFNKWVILFYITFLVLTLILLFFLNNKKLPRIRKIFNYISSFLLIYLSIGIIIFIYNIVLMI